MSKETINELIKEITGLLEPVKTKGTVVMIVAFPHGESPDEYAVFGNLPQGENKKLVIDVAIDMAGKDICSKIEILKAMSEWAEGGTTVN